MSGDQNAPDSGGDRLPAAEQDNPTEPTAARRSGRGMSQEEKRSHKGVTVEFRVFPEEAARLKERAAEASMTVSEFCRRATSGKRINSRFDYDAIIRLCKVQGDQARLGNLLKLAVGQAGKGFDTKSVDDITDKLVETQEIINQILREFSRR